DADTLHVLHRFQRLAPEALHRLAQPRALGRPDALECALERRRAPRAPLDDGHERALTGDDVELERPEAHVASEDREAPDHQVVDHRELGPTADLGTLHFDLTPGAEPQLPRDGSHVLAAPLPGL